MDEALSTQPRDMYWSVLGMMNNPWFRVAIAKENGTLIFEHPTDPTGPEGWMERVKKVGGDLTNGNWGARLEEETQGVPESEEVINVRKEGLNRAIGLQEFKSYIDKEGLWFIVNGEVYDGTPFLEGHPGGAQSIISSTGLDVSDDFLAIHSETAKAMMPEYHIGTVDKDSLEALKNNYPGEPSEPHTVFLQPQAWTNATLAGKKDISWDTRIFTFQLEHKKQTLGLPVGQHIMIKIPDPSCDNKSIIRSYTPISETGKEGAVDLLIKIYSATPATPGGKMTTVLDKLALGSSIECKGPTGRFEYLGDGKVVVSGKKRHVRSFKMICGGTGITPIFQVLRAVMRDPQDPTSCVVLDGNRREEDILCRSELDAFATSNSRKCQVIHTLTKAQNGWTGRRGRISEALLKEYALPGDESMVLVCGPKAMESYVRRTLLAQGWAESSLHFF